MAGFDHDHAPAESAPEAVEAGRARWQQRYDAARKREADFTTLSGVDVDPVYGPRASASYPGFELDCESAGRTDGSLAESASPPYKNFLGVDQTAWLEALLQDYVPVNLLIAGSAYLADPVSGVPDPDDVDKVWVYPKWRECLGDFVKNTRATNGQPINVVWMGGDRHAIAFDNGTVNNPYGGFPCLVGSGWCHKPLPTRPGEIYSLQYPSSGTDSPVFVMQYLRGTIHDDPVAQTVTMDVELRYLKPVDGVDGADGWNWTMQANGSGTASWPYVTTT